MAETVQASLFVNASRESRRAVVALRRAGVYFTITTPKQNSEHKPPYVVAREGDFSGISGINTFIEIITQRPKIT